MKVTSKKNHDSLWVKISEGKEWAKWRIGHSGDTISGSSREIFNAMSAKVEECRKMEGFKTYGDQIDWIVAEFSK